MNPVVSSIVSGSYAANDLSFVTACSALAVLIFGVMVFARSQQRGATRPFLVLALSAAGWLFCFALMYASGDAQTALMWAQRGHFVAAFIPAAAFHFVLHYVGLRRKLSGALYAIWALCMLSGLSGVILTSVIPGVRSFRWGYYPQASMVSLAEIAFYGIVILWGVALLVKTARRGAGEQRRRAYTMAVAISIGGLALFDILPSLGVPMVPLGFIAVIAFLAVAASVIWREELALTPEYAAGHVLQTMKSAVLVIDMHGRIRVVNRATTSMLGYSSEELIGEHIRRIVEPDDRMSTGQLLNSLGVYEQNMAWRTSSGTRLDVLAASSYVRDEKATPVGVVYVANDYTERKRAQESLRESEERYRTLFDANPLPMWVYDFSTLGYIAVNEAAVRHYGYTREEFLTMSLGDLSTLR